MNGDINTPQFGQDRLPGQLPPRPDMPTTRQINIVSGGEAAAPAPVATPQSPTAPRPTAPMMPPGPMLPSYNSVPTSAPAPAPTYAQAPQPAPAPMPTPAGFAPTPQPAPSMPNYSYNQPSPQPIEFTPPRPAMAPMPVMAPTVTPAMDRPMPAQNTAPMPTPVPIETGNNQSTESPQEPAAEDDEFDDNFDYGVDPNAPAISKTKKVVAGVVAVVIVAGGGYFGLKPGPKPIPTPHYFPASINISQVKIPLYYPVNLPSGYSVADYKLVGANSVAFTINKADGTQFVVNVAAQPPGFNYSAYKAKYTQPVQYNNSIGINLVAATSSDIEGLIQTKDSDLITLSSANSTPTKDMEIVMAYFKKVQF